MIRSRPVWALGTEEDRHQLGSYVVARHAVQVHVNQPTSMTEAVCGRLVAVRKLWGGFILFSPREVDVCEKCVHEYEMRTI